MSKRSRTPELFLEQLVLDELDRATQSKLRIADDDRKRADVLRSSNAQILSDYPVEKMAASIKDRAAFVEPRQSRRLDFVFVSAGVGMLIAVCVLFFSSGREAVQDHIDPAQDVVRVKNENGLLFIHRQLGQTSQQLQDGDDVKSGDLLQIGYKVFGQTYGVILSMDGRQVITLHFPEQADQSSLLQPADLQMLAHSYELDDAPLFERFFFITSAVPIDVELVLQAARKRGARQNTLTLPSAYQQKSVTLVKTKPR